MLETAIALIVGFALGYAVREWFSRQYTRVSPAPIRPYPPGISHHWLEWPPMLYRMRRLESACHRGQIPTPLNAPLEADALHRYRPGPLLVTNYHRSRLGQNARDRTVPDDQAASRGDGELTLRGAAGQPPLPVPVARPLVRYFGEVTPPPVYCRRQLLANATIAASRVGL
jgi:hypothetical protein